MARLEGRRIVITGGGGGIGAATARLFRQEGADIVLMDRDAQAVERVAGEFGCTPLVVDITDEAQVKSAMQTAVERLGGLDGLVNCAGVTTMDRLEHTSLAVWNDMIGVNMTGTFVVCREAIPHLRAAGEATIVIIASASGVLPSMSGGSYGASKAGVDMMGKYLAIELAPEIRVNSVCPGAVDTNMFRSSTKALSPKETSAFARTHYAMQRIGEPEEMAAAILFLTSRESSFVTGHSLCADGGRTYH